MSQTDQSAANADGATVRAKMNSVFASIFSNSSGPTAPTTTIAYQFWADTTAGLLKIRDSSNAAWITIGPMGTAGYGLAASGSNSDITALSALATMSISGLVTLNGGQIKFPSTQSSSTNANTLDDYEEGTWTPTLTFTTPGDLSVSYTTQVGTYTKIGNLVTISCRIETSAFTYSTASGASIITGMPFVTKNLTDSRFYASVNAQGISKANYTQFGIYTNPANSSMIFNSCAQGQNWTNLFASDCPSGTQQQRYFTLTYQTD